MPLRTTVPLEIVPAADDDEAADEFIAAAPAKEPDRRSYGALTGRRLAWLAIGFVVIADTGNA